jgi:hypothetical protein
MIHSMEIKQPISLKACVAAVQKTSLAFSVSGTGVALVYAALRSISKSSYLAPAVARLAGFSAGPSGAACKPCRITVADGGRAISMPSSWKRIFIRR